MKRIIVSMLAFALFAGFVTLSSGCATSGGTYFQKTRQHKAHVHKDRIYNPADYRYAAADKD